MGNAAPLSTRPRPVLRSLADAAVFMALLAMIVFAMRQAGWLSPEQGRFIAIDGDSLRKGEREYRLHAIDAPELHQTCTSSSGTSYPCGREAQTALRGLIAGKTLACSSLETDRYGRLVATCTAGQININNEMVRLGWAIAYRSHGLEYVGAEAEARKARRGIWQGHFDKPEDWRVQHRNGLVQGGMADEQPQPD
jgi:endonuclease YncB( thermonuclease family)